MTDFLILFAAVLVGTFGFAVIFGVKPNHLAPATLLGGLTYAVFYLVDLLTPDLFLSNLAAAFFAGIAAFGLAVFYRAPAVTFSALGVIPLVPGGALYSMMYGLIAGDSARFRAMGGEALRVGLGIAAGIVFSSTVIGLARPLLHRKDAQKQAAGQEGKHEK
ncbi:MAG: threonine/serine exporter family protein [Clostridia bacterium]|nr:threonine/serine exporter family protein [Clostridia bacterium]